MSDAITPALTAKRWVSLDDIREEVGLACALDCAYAEGGEHAVMALANEALRRANHPAAITYQDLRTLDEAAEAEVGLQSCRGGPDTQAESDRLVDALRSLANRIAALLPPNGA